MKRKRKRVAFYYGAPSSGINFSSSKDTYAMLVIGPSLPVVRYLWSFSRSRHPLPGHWHFFCFRKFAMNPLPLLTCRRSAEHMCLYHRRRDIWVQPRLPECALIHPTRGREPYQPGCPRTNLSIPRHSCIYSRPQEGQFLGTMFARFKRLQPRDDYGGGTGVGLTSAKNHRTSW